MNVFIKKGDVVNVHFSATKSEFNVTVVVTGEAQGYWDLLREDGTPIAIRDFEKIERAKEAPCE